MVRSLADRTFQPFGEGRELPLGLGRGAERHHVEGVEEEDEAVGAKYPSGQTLHATDSVVCPEVEYVANLPATHAAHSESLVNLVAPECLPTEQL